MLSLKGLRDGGLQMTGLPARAARRHHETSAYSTTAVLLSSPSGLMGGGNLCRGKAGGLLSYLVRCLSFSPGLLAVSVPCMLECVFVWVVVVVVVCMSELNLRPGI